MILKNFAQGTVYFCNISLIINKLIIVSKINENYAHQLCLMMCSNGCCRSFPSLWSLTHTDQ